MGQFPSFIQMYDYQSLMTRNSEAAILTLSGLISFKSKTGQVQFKTYSEQVLFAPQMKMKK